jgi:hypothetical protein
MQERNTTNLRMRLDLETNTMVGHLDNSQAGSTLQQVPSAKAYLLACDTERKKERKKEKKERKKQE